MSSNLYLPYKSNPPAVIEVGGFCYAISGIFSGTATTGWDEVNGEFSACSLCSAVSSSSVSSSSSSSIGSLSSSSVMP